MKNLIVQLWGIGNLIQTEPLMRYLESGTILVDQRRNTHEMAPLFEDWDFVTLDDPLEGVFDDVYICGPWLSPAAFGAHAKRVHMPTWTFQGKWSSTEAQVLVDMIGPPGDPAIPRLPRFKDQSSGPTPAIVMSCGYNRVEKGWEFKTWGGEAFRTAIRQVQKCGLEVVLVGRSDEWRGLHEDIGGVRDLSVLPMMDQVQVVSRCVGYLGNDTGWAHICGAYGLPSAVFVADPTRQDPLKNRTAAPVLWQFNREASPERVADCLLREIDYHAEEGPQMRQEAAEEGEITR